MFKFGGDGGPAGKSNDQLEKTFYFDRQGVREGVRKKVVVGGGG